MNFESHDFPGRGKKIGIIGVPLGYGAGLVGSDLGVSALLKSRIRGSLLTEHIRTLGYEITDHGNVEIVNPDYVAAPDDNPKYLPEMIASYRSMAMTIETVIENGEFPLILGGDHSIAGGTISGVSAFFQKRNEEIGLIWFDAHADMNTPETSPSGNLHGMPLAALLGAGEASFVNLHGFAPKINPRYCAHVGARDLDQGEKDLIRRLGMRENFFTMSDIDRRGMVECVKEAISIASGASAGYAVTFDVDVIDPRFAPGSGTLVRGGITYREAHLGLEMVAEAGGMRSFEIVEVNPLLDAGNVTVELAGELILSALGKTIL